MVKIDLITGFLGAGKTTFLKKYAAWLMKQGLRIGILENDFGAVNVDMMLLRELEGENCELEMVSAAATPRRTGGGSGPSSLPWGWAVLTGCWWSPPASMTWMSFLTLCGRSRWTAGMRSEASLRWRRESGKRASGGGRVCAGQRDGLRGPGSGEQERRGVEGRAEGPGGAAEPGA